MKIKFTKLPTTTGTIKVSLDGGQSFTDYNIADIHESGITLSDDQDYDKIQIQAPANILKNLNVVSSVKVDDGSSSVEEYETYIEKLYVYINSDYGHVYFGIDKHIFFDDEPNLFILYDNYYYKLNDSDNSVLPTADFEGYYIQLNGEIIPVMSKFSLTNGRFSGSDVDPDNLVNILTYEKGVGGTATIKGIEVNYKTDNPQLSGDDDYSYYYWDSPSISVTGNQYYLYRTEDGYKTIDEMAEELRTSLLSSGPVDVYAKLKDKQYYKLPIKLS